MDRSSLPLAVAGLSHAFGGVSVLRDVSFRVPAGGVVSLVGPSGCGKTTLLRLLAGIERPLDGRIEAGGRVLSDARTFVEPEDRGIGFLFQDYALFPHLDVEGNVGFGLRRRGREAARQIAAQVLERLGIGHLRGRFPHMLSGGEQQRVALARALAPRPGVMLLDEPFSNLDRGLREHLRTQSLAVLREHGTTVVMVTHDPEEALSSGDRVVLLRKGLVVQDGTPSELFENPADAQAAEFFAGANRIAGTCGDGFLHTPLGRFAAPDLPDGTRATAYVRPHVLSLEATGDGVEGRVTRRLLLGEIEEVRLAVPGHEGELCVRSTQRTRFQPGETVRIAVPSKQVFVFAVEDPS